MGIDFHCFHCFDCSPLRALGGDFVLGGEMFDIKIDISEFMRAAEKVEGAMQQMPYALSRALNEAADHAKRLLVEDTWPTHVHVRNTGFITHALQIERSTKGNLRVEIYDSTPNKVNLKLHDEGGVKMARGGRFAIPSSANVTRTGKGVRADQRPRNLRNAIVKNGFIFQQQGGSKNRRLALMYTLRPSVRQPADVPFTRDFNIVMRDSLRVAIPYWMGEAMKTRK